MASEGELKLELRRLYPKLELVEFELVKAAGPSGRAKQIFPISSSNRIPSVEQLRAVRAGTIYVRPLSILFPEANTPNEETTVCPASSLPSIEEEYLDVSVDEIPNLTLEGDSIGSLLLLREDIYQQHPGHELIVITRDAFLTKVLGLFKNPAFNFYKEPKIDFKEEMGTDVGAVSKEFFWEALMALRLEKFNERIPLFEGEEDHRIPFTDITLLRDRIYSLAGKLMAYLALHSRIAFVGLSLSVVQYITMEKPDSELNVDVDYMVKIRPNDEEDLMLGFSVEELDKSRAPLFQQTSQLVANFQELQRQMSLLSSQLTVVEMHLEECRSLLRERSLSANSLDCALEVLTKLEIFLTEIDAKIKKIGTFANCQSIEIPIKSLKEQRLQLVWQRKEIRDSLTDELETAVNCKLCLSTSLEVVLQCGHQMCQECARKISDKPIMQRQCPFCKQNLVIAFPICN